VTTGYLVGDALVAERAQQPVEYLGRISLRHRLNDTGSLRISTDIIKKGQRASQTADPSDQIDRTIIVLGDIVGGRTGLISNRLLRQLVGWNRFQIRDTNLRCASLSPSMYRCVV
jgi:hypothetical protein